MTVSDTLIQSRYIYKTEQFSQKSKRYHQTSKNNLLILKNEKKYLTENKDYGMKQSEIRRAIEYAIAQWFSDSFECPIDTRYKVKSADGNSYDYIYRIVPRKARSISPFTTANPPFQKADPGYITTGVTVDSSKKTPTKKYKLLYWGMKMENYMRRMQLIHCLIITL